MPEKSKCEKSELVTSVAKWEVTAFGMANQPGFVGQRMCEVS